MPACKICFDVQHPRNLAVKSSMTRTPACKVHMIIASRGHSATSTERSNILSSDGSQTEIVIRTWNGLSFFVPDTVWEALDIRLAGSDWGGSVDYTVQFRSVVNSAANFALVLGGLGYGGLGGLGGYGGLYGGLGGIGGGAAGLGYVVRDALFDIDPPAPYR